ncbi:ligase-associated DNA damage response endonuclease PdeM [Aquimarina sp. MMG016]|uniref:ligase-associated DNA damage response endonuclease PdeM n=1 Tax=Aquimarina sp. MMG016 TaxID=2822690 RepID=UPI001B3A155F|nr:ligase-associated DNA damage response endonuclease PdeM [Aquimarina sp. MMG016]MBQ4820410.1 ligase-associated DNA damage response endonuclease PdeM [Aquimarina sp. MMG016]
MIKTETININKETFTLHPSGAMYWKEKKMLLIADVHLGKVTHFRKHGSAIPLSAIQYNFHQLDSVLLDFKPEVLCFLGDLFHSYINSEWQLFTTWIKNITPKVVLVTGNHDIISPSKYEEININVTAEWLIDSILLTHIPEIREHTFNISGHIHPGIRLKGLGKQSISVPCFIKKKNQMILPAFGTFTGKYIISPNKEDQAFVITKDEVIRID